MKITLCLLLLLASCGPGADFSGAFSGTVIDAEQCGDGSSGNSSSALTWTIVQSGDTLTVNTHGGTCSGIQAKVSGDSAAVQAGTCSSFSNNAGGVTTPSITAGTLSLVKNTLTVSVSVTENCTYASGAPFWCTSSITGNLTR